MEVEARGFDRRPAAERRAGHIGLIRAPRRRARRRAAGRISACGVCSVWSRSARRAGALLFVICYCAVPQARDPPPVDDLSGPAAVRYTRALQLQHTAT